MMDSVLADMHVDALDWLSQALDDAAAREKPEDYFPDFRDRAGQVEVALNALSALVFQEYLRRVKS